MKGSVALLLLKAALWFTCFFHIFVGLSLNLDIGVKEWIGSTMYYADVDWTHAQFVYILRPLGAFMLTLGVIAAVAARDPLGQKAIVYAFILLWSLRTLQRVLFWDQIQAAFAISTADLLSGTLVVFGSALVLIVLLYLSMRARPATPKPARLAGASW